MQQNLTPTVMGREEARKFTAEVVAETIESFKELGLVK
jgi:hypothetical protein